MPGSARPAGGLPCLLPTLQAGAAALAGHPLATRLRQAIQGVLGARFPELDAHRCRRRIRDLRTLEGELSVFHGVEPDAVLLRPELHVVTVAVPDAEGRGPVLS